MGETIEVDADPNRTIQCSSGIHCLAFSNEKYDMNNVHLGPKVAILEVEDEDIIYYEENGKCRVRKAKVIEIKEPELWMKTGNGSSDFAYLYARDVLKGHDEELKHIIMNSKNANYAYFYAKDVLKGHDEELKHIIVNSKNANYAYLYARDVLKGHDEKLDRIIDRE